MTDQISTPAQMREAAALAVANIEIGYHDGIGGDWHPYNGLHIISAACAAIRALPVADPLCTWPSCGHTAKGQCNPTFAPPVAERQKPQAVRVKPLVWVETFEDRGDGLSEHNGGYESASVLGFYEIGMGFGSDAYYWSVCDPNYNEIGSFEDPSYAKSAAQADYEARILAALDVSETPESERQTYLLSANERQEVRDKALDDAAQAASNRAAYWWDEATAADDTGRKKISLSYEAKALACTELAAVIRVLKGTKA